MQEERERYDGACKLLPNKWQTIAEQLPEHIKKRAEELRLRVEQPMTVLLPEGERLLVQGKLMQRVSSADLEQLCDIVCGYSRYAVSQTLAQGFLTAEGGYRVGFCGTAVITEGVNTNLREISSAAIRIGREQKGIAMPLLANLFEQQRFCNTLIVSPPGGGKTTLLRDLIRCLSDGTEDYPALRVALADERGEVAGMYRGEPQFQIGCHTDVLDNCPKSTAVEILVRTMNPQVIAVDEITAVRDVIAIESAVYCGASILATVHGDDVQSLKRKKLTERLLHSRLFERAIIIKRKAGERQYEVVKLPCHGSL